MTAGPVNRALLESFFQSPGQIYDDTKTEGAMDVLADQIDDNYNYVAGIVAGGTAEMLGVINVKSFGAVGNGVADDTAAIQAAINAANGVGKREIIFPYGTYLYTVLTGTTNIVAYTDGATLTGTTPLTQTSVAAHQAEIAQFGINPLNAPYNAVGNGVADDTAALTAAIAATPKEGTLIISKPHKVTSKITINKKINVLCIGSGCIIPSSHTDTAVVIGDENGILHYADMRIDIKVLGGSSTRTYGLILRNLSNCRINATVMCGATNGTLMQGVLVSELKIITSVNYPGSYNQSFTMPTNGVRASFSNVVGGYIGGCNANNLNFIMEGCSGTGFIVDDHQSQGDNFLGGTIQGCGKGFDITNTFGLVIDRYHSEANTNASVLTNAITTDITASFNDDSLSLVSCDTTNISSLMCRNLTVDSACVATTIQSLTINGGTFTDNAKDTEYTVRYATSTVVSHRLRSAFVYHKNGTNQTGVADSVDTLVTLSTAAFDNKNENVFAASTFKPKLNGKYLLSATIGFTTSVNPDLVTIKLQKSGVGGGTIKQAVGNKIEAIVDHTDENAGYYQIFINQTTGAPIAIDGASAKTWFQGAWLGY